MKKLMKSVKIFHRVRRKIDNWRRKLRQSKKRILKASAEYYKNSFRFANNNATKPKKLIWKRCRNWNTKQLRIRHWKSTNHNLNLLKEKSKCWLQKETNLGNGFRSPKPLNDRIYWTTHQALASKTEVK